MLSIDVQNYLIIYKNRKATSEQLKQHVKTYKARIHQSLPYPLQSAWDTATRRIRQGRVIISRVSPVSEFRKRKK